jgi:NAD(P)-dependent dehydrogenase (short-subunit alcohol dehydrogenase family)
MSIFLITGASQGIGAAMALQFAAEPSAQLALVARNEANLKLVAAQCEQKGAEVAVFVCDVTDEASVGAMARGVQDRFGVPDVVVNNAGVFKQASFLEASLEDFRSQIEVNLTSAFIVTKAFLPAMIEAKKGHFFFMASVASIRAYTGGVAYCAAKHGLLGLARVVREETKEAGIRVTTLMPGATFTPSWESVDLPESRFMPPEDIARTVLDVWKMSDRTVIEEMVLRPQLGDL